MRTCPPAASPATCQRACRCAWTMWRSSTSRQALFRFALLLWVLLVLRCVPAASCSQLQCTQCVAGQRCWAAVGARPALRDGCRAVAPAHVPRLHRLPAQPSLTLSPLCCTHPQVMDGVVTALYPAGQAAAHSRAGQVDLRGKMVLPTFADLHTHIGGGRGTCLRLEGRRHAVGMPSSGMPSSEAGRQSTCITAWLPGVLVAAGAQCSVRAPNSLRGRRAWLHHPPARLHHPPATWTTPPPSTPTPPRRQGPHNGAQPQPKRLSERRRPLHGARCSILGRGRCAPAHGL